MTAAGGREDRRAGIRARVVGRVLSQMHGVGPYLPAFAPAGFLSVALADLVAAQRGR